MDEQGDPRKAFDRIWTPLIGLGILLAFAVQQISPFINPLLVVLFVIPTGWLYVQSFSAVVEKKKIQGIAMCVYVLFGLVAIGAGVMGAAQSLQTINEISAPCSNLRKILLTGPNSEAADTYSALHCPVYLPAYHWP